MSEILLSVAVVTRNRPDSLERTLKSLSLQNPQPYEVIVSDDSNSDEAIELNKEVARKFRYKYISGLKEGLYTNRNFVAQLCTGTHIRTMDDDHEFPDEHLKICLEAIKREPEIIWTIGEYNPWDKERSVPVKERTPGQLNPRGFAYIPKDMNTYYGIACGASIYPRSVIEKRILSIDAYKFGLLYLEYGARLYKLGYKIKHLDATYVLHHVEKNDVTIASSKTIISARLVCMFLFSFKYFPSIKNKLLTIYQVVNEMLSKSYNFKLVLDAFRIYERESKNIYDKK